mmetsp:Transcript_85849/g.134245  ORF Transcript_85849/g.134245 Transcript_85849/m.134245 type:complete len:303 (+) Transcript_85849:69-977(+)
MASTEEALPLLKRDLSTCKRVGRSCIVVTALLVVTTGVYVCYLWRSHGGVVVASSGDFKQALGTFGEYDANAPARITSSVLKDAGGAGHDGYLAVIANAAPHFHIEGSCTSVAKTSATAKEAGCRYAVNGGPFNSWLSGGCIGPTISHGRVLNEDWNTSYASFGLTSKGEWVVGHFASKAILGSNIVEGMTGFGWLVRNGRSVAPSDDQKAERTAIGVNRQGDLMLLQVDGCERCPFSGGASGLTLQELAKLLVSKDAVNAINLDGGGSSTTVENGEVKNRPDCLELGIECERSVTSVVCIS